MLLASDLPQMLSQMLSQMHSLHRFGMCDLWLLQNVRSCPVKLPEALLAPDKAVLAEPEVGLLPQVYKHLWPYWTSWGTCQHFCPGQGSYSA